MIIGRRILAGYFALCAILIVVGSFGLVSIKRLAALHEGGEAHFRSLAATAAEASGEAKRAESELVMYLALRQPAHRMRYVERREDLHRKIAHLNANARLPEARRLIAVMTRAHDELRRSGETLLRAAARHEAANGRPADLKRFHQSAALIRDSGLKLAWLETDFLNKQASISAATEASSYAKRAEGHLMLYLILGDRIDREKFFARHQELLKQIQVLDERVRARDARRVLPAMASEAGTLLRAGQALLRAYDASAAAGRRFDLAEFSPLVQTLHSSAESLHGNGVSVAKSQLALEAAAKDTARSTSRFVQRLLIASTVAALLLAVVLGYLMARSIVRPLDALKKAVAAVAAGDLSVEIGRSSRDELGDLVVGFDHMVAELRSSNDKLLAAKRDTENVLECITNALLVVSPAGKVESVNTAAAEMLQYRPEELIGVSLALLIDPSALSHPLAAIVRGDVLLHSSELVFLRNDGGRVETVTNSSIVRDPAGNISGILMVVADVGALKRAEEEIRNSREQLRALTKRMLSMQEDERVAISREIHDELGQRLTALKIDLSWVARRVEDAMPHDKLVQMASDIDSAIAAVRRISSELRPMILKDLGLSAAIRDEVRRFTERTGIEVRLDIAPGDFELDTLRSTTVYRVVQEALTNVARHAEATRVDLTLCLADDALELTVKDDGRGISPEDVESPASLGIMGIRERTTLLGGEMTLSGGRGRGSTLYISLPLPPAGHETVMT